jgi:hypothetical protein
MAFFQCRVQLNYVGHFAVHLNGCWGHMCERRGSRNITSMEGKKCGVMYDNKDVRKQMVDLFKISQRRSGIKALTSYKILSVLWHSSSTKMQVKCVGHLAVHFTDHKACTSHMLCTTTRSQSFLARRE